MGAIKTHYVFGRMNWKPVCSRTGSKLARKPPRMLAIFSISLLLRRHRRIRADRSLSRAVLADFGRLSGEP
jgi:hypothetical protein